jgi:ribosomal protein L11 methyltransferase
LKMKRRWQEITLLVPAVWEEVLPEFLEEVGISGLWIEREKGPPFRSILRGYVSEQCWRPTSKSLLTGHLERLADILSPGDAKAEMQIRLIEEEDWVSKWLPFFEPLRVGPVWIRPEEKAVPLSDGECEIVVNPGLAFGTGHHETTQLCLEVLWMLRERLEDHIPILDLGTGSGILAMFAARVGFDNILVLDNDPIALETARKNLAINGLELVIEVGGHAISRLTDRFALIMANLTAGVLMDLAAEIGKHLHAGGWLVTSGLLVSEADRVAHVFRSEGMALVEKREKNDWACLIFRCLEEE